MPLPILFLVPTALTAIANVAATAIGVAVTKSTVESFVDEVVRDTVEEPAIGSVVYTELMLGGLAEHSGIYIGDNQIVELSGQGIIQVVSPDEFISGGTGLCIHVSCHDTIPVGCTAAARRAQDSISDRRDYSFLTDNCHQFTAGCLTGDFEGHDNFLWFLKGVAEKELGADTWRVWKRS
ncbi:TPA: hypothetical protein KD885_003856 [Vibrio parahaemolyticus]|nr:hypothetical protein [Vibrio parahaemolyticus]